MKAEAGSLLEAVSEALRREQPFGEPIEYLGGSSEVCRNVLVGEGELSQRIYRLQGAGG